jgi:hypothetical protein
VLRLTNSQRCLLRNQQADSQQTLVAPSLGTILMLQLYAINLILLHWLYILYSSHSLETASWHQEPAHWLEGSSVVIVDPPRKGLHPTVISALQKIALSEHKAFKAKRYGCLLLTVYNVINKYSDSCEDP